MALRELKQDCNQGCAKVCFISLFFSDMKMVEVFLDPSSVHGMAIKVELKRKEVNS